MCPNLIASDPRRLGRMVAAAPRRRLCARIAPAVFVASAALLFSSPHHARAADKQACLDAYREAQRARRDGDLLRAREQLLVCAQPACPTVVSSDCVPWLDDVVKELPSVVLVARTHDGRDVVNVKVTLDGKPLASAVSGKPIEVNPGVHAFRFEAAGFPPVTQELVVAATEKNRVVAVTFQGKGGGSSPAAAPADVKPVSRPIPTMAYVAGGVGLAGWVGLTWFGFRFDSQVGDLNRCDPVCPQSQIDEAASTRRLAFLSLGVGVIGTGLAGYLYLTRPERVESAASGPRLTITAAPMRNGGGAAVLGSF